MFKVNSSVQFIRQFNSSHTPIIMKSAKSHAINLTTITASAVDPDMKAAELSQRTAEAQAAADLGSKVLQKKLDATVAEAKKTLENHLAKVESWDIRQKKVEDVLTTALSAILNDPKKPYSKLLSAFEEITGRVILSHTAFKPVGVRKDMTSNDVLLFRNITRDKWEAMSKEKNLHVAVQIPAITAKANADLDQISSMFDSTAADGSKLRLVKVDSISQKVATPKDLVTLIEQFNAVDKKTDELREALQTAEADRKAAMDKMSDVSINLAGAVLSSTETGRTMLESVMRQVNDIAEGKGVLALSAGSDDSDE